MQRTKSQSEQAVQTTDIRTRKVGNFEMHSLVGCGIYNLNNCISPVENITDAKFLILEFESVDGRKVCPRPLTSFLMYNAQDIILENIIQNEYAYLNVGDSSVSMTDTERRAEKLNKGEIQSTTYPMGLRYLAKNAFLSMADSFQVSVGLRSCPRYDRDCSEKIHSSCVDTFDSLGMYEDLNSYIQMVKAISDEFETAYVVSAENPRCLEIQIGGEVYDVYFEGRPDGQNHVPSVIAEEIGCSTFENLVGEEVLVGSGKYSYRKNRYNVVGTNRSDVLSFATPD